MATKPPNGADVLSRLAEDVLPTLIARLDRSRLGELEVRQDGWRIRLRRTTNGLAHDIEPPLPAGRRIERKPDRSPDGAGADGRPQALRSADRGPLLVSSPAVGYFLPRDNLAAGASLRAGDLIGYVDVLGVRQDVVAPEDGVLVALDVGPAEAVEYGEPLARMERARTGGPSPRPDGETRG